MVSVCVCEMDCSRASLDGLLAHIAETRPDFLVLPEFPFSPDWFCASPEFLKSTWDEKVQSHADGNPSISLIFERSPSTVVLTARPVNTASGARGNSAYTATASGSTHVHHKHYIPEEDENHEQVWFDRIDNDFSVSKDKIGFLTCSELWWPEHARDYGRAGGWLTATPRATGVESVPRWLAAGKVAAFVSGAFSASSNRVGGEFGGVGWVIDPQGEILALTSKERPFVTVEIDREAATRARTTYPRYIL
jgi:N-carbamoylputrescine amidase